MVYYIAGFLAVMSIVTLLLYAADKRRAKKNAWRIPEKTLLGAGFFGGAIGALIAMQWFRHKTKHWYFWAVNIPSALLHLALLGFFWFRNG